MTDDREAIRAALAAERYLTMDDLLSRWHHWLHPVRVSRGHASTAAGCGSYVTSRQYDDTNGALDDQIEHRTMQGVQACHERMQHPESTYILTEARNLHSGVAVWRHPRLPSDPGELAELRVRAREQMLGLMLSAGLVE